MFTEFEPEPLAASRVDSSCGGCGYPTELFKNTTRHLPPGHLSPEPDERHYGKVSLEFIRARIVRRTELLAQYPQLPTCSKVFEIVDQLDSIASPCHRS